MKATVKRGSRIRFVTNNVVLIGRVIGLLEGENVEKGFVVSTENRTFILFSDDENIKWVRDGGRNSLYESDLALLSAAALAK